MRKFETDLRMEEDTWSCWRSCCWSSRSLSWRRTLANAPQFNVAVQGETGAQPEGSFLNLINWIGNVIAPVGAGGAVVGAVVSWLTGRGFARWLFAAGALLLVSGVTRLVEFWITNGTGGIT